MLFHVVTCTYHFFVHFWVAAIFSLSLISSTATESSDTVVFMDSSTMTSSKMIPDVKVSIAEDIITNLKFILNVNFYA